MKKQKKRIYPALVGVLATVCACSVWGGVSGLQKADAAIRTQNVYSDSFNAKELSDSWLVTDATIKADYSSLRVLPDQYAWPGHILCQGYKLDGDCRLVMQTQKLPSEDASWYALSFGVPSTVSIFEKASGALIFGPDQTLLFKEGQPTGDAFGCSPMGNAVNGEVATVILEFAQNPDTTYNITYSVQKGDAVLGSYTVQNFPVQNGYFGFNTYGTNFDVLSFDVYEGDEKVYADDFTTSVMSYDDNVTKGSAWVALSPYTSKTASIAPVGSLDLSAIDSGVVYKDPFVKKSEGVAVLYELSAQFDFANAQAGVATGFEVGKATADADGVFVGLMQKSGGYQMVLSVGDRKETILLAENPSNGLWDLSVAANYDNSVTVTANGFTTTFELEVGVDGYFGITTPSRCATSGVGAVADDFNYQRYTYNETVAQDLKINFEGTREYEDADGKYYQYYFSSKDWYAGSNVRVANYGFTENGYVLFGNASVDSSFGPKEKYGDCIVRFDVTLVGSDYYYNNPDTYFDTPDGRGACDAECFGLQFGSKTYRNIYANAQSLGIATYNGKSIYFTTNCTRATAQEEIVHLPNSPQTSDYEYDLFKKSATYNFMYVIQNGTVTMHFKEASEPESVLGIVREYVTGVETNGCLAVYGANGVDFRLDNFSVTNLDRSYTSSVYTGGEDLQTVRVDTTKGDSLSMFDTGANTLTTKGVTGSNITRVTLGNMNGLTYKQGDLEIVFSENGAVVSDGLVRKDISFDAPLLLRGATVEISRIGDKVTVGFANAGAPLAAIDGNSYTVSGLKAAGREKITISDNGGVRLTKVAIFNLDSKMTIETRNFNAELDITQPWVPRQSIQGNGNGALIGIIIGAVAVVAAGAVAVVVILKRKKKENA